MAEVKLQNYELTPKYKQNVTPVPERMLRSNGSVTSFRAHAVSCFRLGTNGGSILPEPFSAPTPTLGKTKTVSHFIFLLEKSALKCNNHLSRMMYC